MKLMLSTGGLNDTEKRAIIKTKVKFEQKLNEIDTSKETAGVVSARRKYLNSNRELEIIFRMFWMIMQEYLDPVTDLIQEGGYLMLNMLIQHALIGGQLNEIESRNLAKIDYINDTACYGPLGRQCFYDILLELVEMWAENGVPKLSTSFAWALLNRLIEITSPLHPSFTLSYPPSLQHRRYRELSAEISSIKRCEMCLCS
jgi:hypothetical protein